MTALMLLRMIGVALALHGVGAAAQEAPAEPPAAAAGATESVDQALCRLIERSARAHGLPADFLTRLIWRESSFRSTVISPAGAQGIAQFMPRTAAERGLADPFDPEQAIPHAAHLLADHLRQFGNLGLAAAAYNGGPTRVANWLEGRGTLPEETRNYVFLVTRRAAEDWAEAARGESGAAAPTFAWPPGRPCLETIAAVRRPGRDEMPAPVGVTAALAPWGVQLAGNFSKERALASFARARDALAKVIGGTQPMVIGTRLRSRGTRAFYRVRVPAETRAAANTLCNRIRAAGGACIVLRS
jgi:hypothetical protein